MMSYPGLAAMALSCDRGSSGGDPGEGCEVQQLVVVAVVTGMQAPIRGGGS